MKKINITIRIVLCLLFLFSMEATIAQNENALNFDGLNDYVLLPQSTHSQISSNGTIEAWFKTSQDNSSYRAIVVRNNYYGLFLVNNRLCTYVFGGQTPGLLVASSTPLNDNQWHHVVLAFQINVTNGSQIYLDGVAVGSPFKLSTSTSSYSFQIGANTTQQYFKGTIDEVKIWSRKLTSQEIENTSNCIAPATSNLVGYYKFNNGNTGQSNAGLVSLADSSGLNNNGTLMNFNLNGSSSNWVSGYTCPCSTPTGNANQTFCFGATVADLIAIGDSIQWYDNPTGGNVLDSITSLIDNSTYYATQTAGGCESNVRFSVSVGLTPSSTSIPTGSSNQQFCDGLAVSDLVASGNNIRWYNTVNGGTSLPTSTILLDNTTYYATQTVAGCESNNRLGVTVTIKPIPSAPTGNSNQNFCFNGLVSDLQATGNNISWYGSQSGSVALTSNSILSSGNYFATQTIDGCQSSDSLLVNVVVTSYSNSVNLNGTTLSATLSGASYQWLNCATNTQISGATSQSFSPSTSGNYAVIISLNGCSSQSTCSNISLANLEEIKKNKVEIYPNPTSSMIYIKLDKESEVRILDVTGKIISQIEGSTFYSIDVSRFKEGLYFIENSDGVNSKFYKK